MNYVILEKARPYIRHRLGKLQHVSGYANRLLSNLPKATKVSKLVEKEMKKYITKIAMDKVRSEVKTWQKRNPDSPMKAFHGTSANNIYKILFEGLKPQSYHNFDRSFYKGKRSDKVFITDDFTIAQSFASTAEWKTGSPAVILEAVIPVDFWKKAEADEKSGGTSFMLKEIKPEWITNAYDMDKRPMTETIDSLRLKKFEKAGKLVYIPISLAVLKNIFKKEEE